MKSAFAFAAAALVLAGCASAPLPSGVLLTQEGRPCPDGHRYLICKSKEAWRETKWRSEDGQARRDRSPLTIARDPSIPKYETLGSDGQPIG